MTAAPAKDAGRRLLVVAPNWLGDLVMATSLLESLATDPSRPRLTVSLRSEWEPLLRDDPRVDGLLSYDRGGRHRGLDGLFRLAAQWRREGFAEAILLPPSLRVAVAARLAGIPRLIGFRSDGRGFLLEGSVRRPLRGSMHYCEELGLLLAAWRREPTAAGEAPAPRLPGLAERAEAAPTPEGPPLWVLGVGTTYGSAKNWPAAAVASFADAVVGRRGARVVLVGDAAGRAMRDAVRRGCSAAWRDDLVGGPAVVDRVGRTDLSEVAALLRDAAVYVGNDSGLMHLAAALGAPTVGIFGSSSPAWTAPRGRRTAVVAATGFPCQPCYRPECRHETFCLDTVSPEEVLAVASSLAVRREDSP